MKGELYYLRSFNNNELNISIVQSSPKAPSLSSRPVRKSSIAGVENYIKYGEIATYKIKQLVLSKEQGSIKKKIDTFQKIISWYDFNNTLTSWQVK